MSKKAKKAKKTKKNGYFKKKIIAPKMMIEFN